MFSGVSGIRSGIFFVTGRPILAFVFGFLFSLMLLICVLA